MGPSASQPRRRGLRAATLSDSGPRPNPTLEVTPGVGVLPVLFAHSEEDVRRVLGEPQREVPGFWHYFDNCMQINFTNGKVNFVELSWCDSHFDVKYEGVSVFHTLADEVVRLISGAYPVAEPDTFIDLELDLGLWRPVLPSSRPPDAPYDEYRNGLYWLTIGLGHGDFYRGLGRSREGSRPGMQVD